MLTKIEALWRPCGGSAACGGDVQNCVIVLGVSLVGVVTLKYFKNFYSLSHSQMRCGYVIFAQKTFSENLVISEKAVPLHRF